MRISNWCVLAAMLMIVFCLTWGMKYQLLWKLSYTELCYSQITDNALEDGLKAGTAEDSSAIPYVDEGTAVNCFKESLLKGFDLTEETPGGKRLLDCISCIIILQNNYFSVITKDQTVQYPYQTEYKDWIIWFSMDGSVCCQHKKTMNIFKGTEEQIRTYVGYQEDNDAAIPAGSWQKQVVTDCVEKQMERTLKEQITDKQYGIDFPQIREDACHTLEGISMLAFIQYGIYHVDGLDFNRYVLSGVRVAE